MRNLRLTRIVGLTATVGIILLGAGVASASAAVPITANPSCCTFDPGPFTQDQGETETFVNPPNSSFHDVTSTQNGSDGKPLFASDAIGADNTVPVKGTQYLTAGSYKFYCTIHGPSMNGTLVVSSNGTPVPRPVAPSVKVSILGQSLKKVRNSKKLKVKITAGSVAASGIKLEVTKGSKKFGSASGLKLAAKASKTVSVKLSSSAVKTIKNSKKVTFKVKASLTGGKSVTTSRKLK